MNFYNFENETLNSAVKNSWAVPEYANEYSPIDENEKIKVVDPTDDRQYYYYNWKSNVLISSREVKNKFLGGLKHLTSFYERSLNNQGRTLSKSFKEYICSITAIDYYAEYHESSPRISNLDWKNIEDLIRNEPQLKYEEKNNLIDSAHENSQAYLMICEIVEQIPHIFYPVAFAIASSLIGKFKSMYIYEEDENQIISMVNENYQNQAIVIHPRLIELGLANENTKNDEKYLEFVRSWMMIFFLALNGYLYNPFYRRPESKYMTNYAHANRFGRKQSKYE